ncbi:MAG: glycine cleavage system protein GcvH [Clostridiales bacterium]|nr:glycine cleavage system protein GcvH [Clostridiales bacterium]
MKVLDELKYAQGHEWVRVEGNKAYIGITDFAQDELGDIVFMELPELESQVDVDDILGTVESVKAASDIYAPVSGRVVEVNDELEVSPELINEDPYEAWIAVIEMGDIGELDDLMDAQEYEKFCEEEA